MEVARMKIPRVDDSLSWGKRRRKLPISNLNRFSDDGNFMAEFMTKEEEYRDQIVSSNFEAIEESTSGYVASWEIKEDPLKGENQLAAKVLQLCMKGKHEEAEKLVMDAEKQKAATESSILQINGTLSRFIMHDFSTKQKRKEEDADLHLAQKITHNHRYNTSNQADEEYDYNYGPTKKRSRSRNSSDITNPTNRILTQHNRCQSCFEYPKRPKHLVIAIANYTYLSLSHQHPIVPGHCRILTLQHESSTRTVEENVWDEIRNFKKCLMMMFAKQEKDLVFIETVIELAQQRNHCLVECIPLPRDIAKQAPLYFKKAIDEAEDEWSQHNAKKLIDTSEKGLRGSIPKNFPYFHVEFGLKRGFVHVIDDEKQFKSSFGLDVIRGMLRLPAENMHRHRRIESVDVRKQAPANFQKEFEPYDWTKLTVLTT